MVPAVIHMALSHLNYSPFQSWGTSSTKAKESLGLPADTEGTAPLEWAKQMQHIFLNLIQHFFCFLSSWQFSSENAIQMPGVHKARKLSTTNPAQTVQKSTLSFHTKNEDN